jgi:long-subunit acyl-CoA synthetase (AMP-forming)
MGYHGVYQKTRLGVPYTRIPGLALFRASIRTPLGELCVFETTFLAPTPPLWEMLQIFFRKKIDRQAPLVKAAKINPLRRIAAEIWRKFDSDLTFLPGIEIFKNVTDCRAPSLCLLRNGPFLAGNGCRR